MHLLVLRIMLLLHLITPMRRKKTTCLFSSMKMQSAFSSEKAIRQVPRFHERRRTKQGDVVAGSDFKQLELLAEPLVGQAVHAAQLVSASRWSPHGMRGRQSDPAILPIPFNNPVRPPAPFAPKLCHRFAAIVSFAAVLLNQGGKV